MVLYCFVVYARQITHKAIGWWKVDRSEADPCTVNLDSSAACYVYIYIYIYIVNITIVIITIDVHIYIYIYTRILIY